MDPQDRFDEKDMNDNHARIGEMKADAMRMVEEMPDAAFETWYTTAFQAMDEAATARFAPAMYSEEFIDRLVATDLEEEIPF